MRVYAQKCGKIEVEIEIEIEAEIEGNRTFGPDVGWLSVMRTGGAWKNQELGMRNGGGGAQIGKRRLMKHDGGFAANAPPSLLRRQLPRRGDDPYFIVNLPHLWGKSKRTVFAGSRRRLRIQ